MNIERYKWPVVITAGLHGALFLCIPDTTVGEPIPVPEKVIFKEIPVDAFVEEKPAEEDPSGGSGGATPLRGAPDIPSPLTNETVFTVPVSTDVPVIDSIRDLKDFPRGPIGPPGDLGENIRRGIPGTELLDRSPRAMVQNSPDYPSAMRQSGTSGSVTVEFVVDTTGRVAKADAIRWTHREFVEPAVRAVMRWKFEPGTIEGRRVRFRMAVPIEFNAEG